MKRLETGLGITDFQRSVGRSGGQALAAQGEGRAGGAADVPTEIFFFQAEDGIRDRDVTGVQTCLFRLARVRISKMRSRTRCQSSAPRTSASRMESTTSAKSTVTCLRSPSRAPRLARIFSIRCRGV